MPKVQAKFEFNVGDIVHFKVNPRVKGMILELMLQVCESAQQNHYSVGIFSSIGEMKRIMIKEIELEKHEFAI